MEALLESHDDKIRAKIQLLKAQMQAKSVLYYQINKLKIEKTYRNLNPDYNNIQHFAALTKQMKIKIDGIRGTLNKLKVSQNSSVEKINLLKEMNFNQFEMPSIEIYLKENEAVESYVCLLNEKLQNLSEFFNKKKLQTISKFESSQKSKLIEQIKMEIQQLTDDVNKAQDNCKRLERKKIILSEKMKRNLEKITIYKNLTGGAFQLRSKKMLKAELDKNMKDAELKIQLHVKNKAEIQEKIQLMEAGLQENAKYVGKIIFDLQESRNHLVRSELKLEALMRDRENIIRKSNNHDFISDRIETNKENEDMTFSVSYLISSFSDLHIEKEALISENNKLKQRITNLFKDKC